MRGDARHRTAIREIEEGVEFEDIDRVRRPGAGRKRVEDENPELLVRLEELVDPQRDEIQSRPAVDLEEPPKAGRGVADGG